VHGQPQPQFGHREKFGNTPEKHRDYSAVTRVARARTFPLFDSACCRSSGHQRPGFRLGAVLKEAGVKTTVFGAKETNHGKLNDNLGSPVIPRRRCS
jgi:hypothetical protein